MQLWSSLTTDKAECAQIVFGPIYLIAAAALGTISEPVMGTDGSCLSVVGGGGKWGPPGKTNRHGKKMHAAQTAPSRESNI